MNIEKINRIFEIWYKKNPNPRTELNYVNHYTLLIAVVMSAQTTDISVNKATEELFKIATKPEEIISLGEEKLAEYIKRIGLYRAKARNVIKLSEILIAKYDSKVPESFDDLVQLPGVGRKTANVVLNCLFGHKTIAVDTHVFRVANRIGFTSEKDVTKTELKLLKIIPQNWLADAHHWIILHGRYICKAIRPKCHECNIAEFCEFNTKNL